MCFLALALAVTIALLPARLITTSFQYRQEAKIFSEKQKEFRDGLSYSTPQISEETRGNAITQPQSHLI